MVSFFLFLSSILKFYVLVLFCVLGKVDSFFLFVVLVCLLRKVDSFLFFKLYFLYWIKCTG